MNPGICLYGSPHGYAVLAKSNGRSGLFVGVGLKHKAHSRAPSLELYNLGGIQQMNTITPPKITQFQSLSLDFLRLCFFV